MAFGRNGEGNGLQAKGGRTDGSRTKGAQQGGARPLVYEDREDLPDGLVLYAYDGRLTVADRAGRETAALSYRRDRWVWRAQGAAGAFDGIAPNPADAWRVILDVLWSGQPSGGV